MTISRTILFITQLEDGFISSLLSQLSSSDQFQDKEDNRIQSTLHSHIIETALFRQADIGDSAAVYRFLGIIGHEQPITSFFDPSGNGVDFFLLPVFYTPLISGSAPETGLQTKPNTYIADRYLIVRQLGKATFSVTIECIDMRGDVNKHLCLKVGECMKEGMMS